MTPEECLEIYGRAWLERDSDRRLELLRRCCTEDILFVDAMLGRLTGLEAVSDMIGQYMSMMRGESPSATNTVTEAKSPSVKVKTVTAIERLHRFFRFSFVWTLSNGQELGGTDFGEFSEDGRMQLIAVFPETSDFPVHVPHNSRVQPTAFGGG